MQATEQITRTVERPLPVSVPIQPFVPSVMAEPRLLAAVEPSLANQLGGWPVILASVWMGVALALFLKGMLAFRRDRNAILRASVELARIGSIRIVRSPLVNGPLAFGIFDRVIAVPAESAQHVLDMVVAAGVKAILNFSPGALKVPPGVKLKSVDLTVSLESLSFFLARGGADGEDA